MYLYACTPCRPPHTCVQMSKKKVCWGCSGNLSIHPCCLARLFALEVPKNEGQECSFLCCIMNEWMLGLPTECLSDYLFAVCEVCYAQASMCASLLPECLWSCFVCGCKSVTQRRLTKTGSDQGVRRAERQCQTGSCLCSQLTNSLLTGWGSCVSLFWHRFAWEFTGHYC